MRLNTQTKKHLRFVNIWNVNYLLDDIFLCALNKAALHWVPCKHNFDFLLWCQLFGYVITGHPEDFPPQRRYCWLNLTNIAQTCGQNAARVLLLCSFVAERKSVGKFHNVHDGRKAAVHWGKVCSLLEEGRGCGKEWHTCVWLKLPLSEWKSAIIIIFQGLVYVITTLSHIGCPGGVFFQDDDVMRGPTH